MTRATHNPEVRFLDGSHERVFRDPRAVVRVHRLEEVGPALEEVRRHVADGLTAAGFVAYEAAPAFDAALTAHPPDGRPLLWFGLFEQAALEASPPPDADAYALSGWTPCIDRGRYAEALTRIREYIAAGDTYQVNYTYPLEARFSGDALAWCRQLCRAQRTAYGAYIDGGDFKVLSASPEIFFALEGDRVHSRPMKGTRARAMTQAADVEVARALVKAQKDRAENVMIVDMVRNDLGRLARDLVETPALFQVERYPTVWQMTSTVSARTDAEVPEILAALFPCASVTGAPKYRTTAIIRALEPSPRGVYCGAVGFWAPGRQAQFSVGIRTVWQDVASGVVRYHTGSGVTWDSDPGEEFEECVQKAAVLGYAPPRFALLETLLYHGGYHLLREHLDRLEASAAYFGFAFMRERMTQQLAREARWYGAGPRRVRVLLSEDGALTLEHSPYVEMAGAFRVCLSARPVDASDVFLYHKTTHRRVYEEARAERAAYDDVVLYNGAGELTETTIGNLVLEFGDGARYTPPISSGLLAGTFRRHLLARGEIAERVLRREDLEAARKVWVINSVRGWVRAVVDLTTEG